MPEREQVQVQVVITPGLDAQVITGPPSAYAEASLESECYRLGPGSDR